MPKLKVRAVIENYPVCAAFIEEQLEKAGLNDRDRIKVVTASEEIIVNIIKYAYFPEEGELLISVDCDAVSVRITFTDNGKEFNSLARPEADTTLAAEDRDIGGLGILMVKRLVDEVSYERKYSQNIPTITKKRIPQ